MPPPPPDSIVCKPTPWFLLRAVAMLLMFSVFAVLFYLDGSTGYRKKNESYYLHRAFQTANTEFSEMNAQGTLTPEAWRAHAENRTIDLPEDASVLPADLARPLPWPPILHDYERMKPLQWNLLWREYSKDRELANSPPEEPYDARKIGEQWVVFWICIALGGVTAFFLIRTMRRSLVVDAQGLVSQQGVRVPYAEMHRLDLRKWDTKGLAFVDYEGASGKGRIRIDGLTYGGFKKENDEPAERLMRLLRAHFSGEVIEYATVEEEPEESDSSTPA